MFRLFIKINKNLNITKKGLKWRIFYGKNWNQTDKFGSANIEAWIQLEPVNLVSRRCRRRFQVRRGQVWRWLPTGPPECKWVRSWRSGCTPSSISGLPSKLDKNGCKLGRLRKEGARGSLMVYSTFVPFRDTVPWILVSVKQE